MGLDLIKEMVNGFRCADCEPLLFVMWIQDCFHPRALLVPDLNDTAELPMLREIELDIMCRRIVMAKFVC